MVYVTGNSIVYNEKMEVTAYHKLGSF